MKVAPTAYVGPKVSGDYTEHVQILDQARVEGEAWLSGWMKITGRARVIDANLSDTFIGDDAVVMGKVIIRGVMDASYCETTIESNAMVRNDDPENELVLTGPFMFGYDAEILADNHYLSVGPISSDNRHITIHRTVGGGHRVMTRYFEGTLGDLQVAIETAGGELWDPGESHWLWKLQYENFLRQAIPLTWLWRRQAHPEEIFNWEEEMERGKVFLQGMSEEGIDLADVTFGRHVTISGQPEITGEHAYLGDFTSIRGNAKIHDAKLSHVDIRGDDVRISGNVEIYGALDTWQRKSLIEGNAVIASTGEDTVRVSGIFEIGRDAEIFASHHYRVIGPLGPQERYLTIYRTKDGGHLIRSGRFEGTINDLARAIELVDIQLWGIRIQDMTKPQWDIWEASYRAVLDLARACVYEWFEESHRPDRPH